MVDFFAQQTGSVFSKKVAFRSEIGEIQLDKEKILLAHPLTYMNDSGKAVSAIKSFYKLSTADILLVHDEMDFEPGKYAFTKKSGPAGHNGVISIQEQLGTTEISRLRIGIGRPTPPLMAENYVLQPFLPQEQETIKKLFPKLEEAIKYWVTHGIDRTMNTWNGV